MNNIDIEPIGYIKSPYTEKFAIPRQPGLVTAAKGKIILVPPYNDPNIVKGLQEFSHIWLIFNFHATQAQGWKSQVRPPRLGGNKKIGVLATRSTFRPNSIGMSVVKLDGINITPNALEIDISSLDLLDKTPIIDIKPYISYSDAIPEATSSYASTAPENNMNIIFQQQAMHTLFTIKDKYDNLEELITQVLMQDPRPAYKKNTIDNKVYGMNLFDLNIQWQLSSTNTIEVIAISQEILN